eukprot:IDg8228t1
MSARVQSVSASLGYSSVSFRGFPTIAYCSWGIGVLLSPWAVIPDQLEIGASLCRLADFYSEFFSTRKKAYPPTSKCFQRMQILYQTDDSHGLSAVLHFHVKGYPTD